VIPVTLRGAKIPFYPTGTALSLSNLHRDAPHPCVPDFFPRTLPLQAPVGIGGRSADARDHHQGRPRDVPPLAVLRHRTRHHAGTDLVSHAHPHRRGGTDGGRKALPAGGKAARGYAASEED